MVNWPFLKGLLLLLLFFRQKKGFNMLKNVQNLCREVESGENLRILEYLEMGVAKWLNSATWNAAPRFPFDRSSQKSQTRCIVTNHTKKSLGAL